ncbi:MAG: glutamate-5-semialdehyde dehydrogenase [Clostridia bacterium]|nr:glutamate-5-semialdehyde dehydrogenase [Clostridia bacterium]NLS84008.1 glutamate-5-semialdehyde dehydrogenase [Oscillospiraceae bacterium]
MLTSDILKNAKAVKTQASMLTTQQKNDALCAMADALEKDSDAILAANKEDIDAAKGTVSDVMLDRLLLTESRIKGMADGIRTAAKLPDPIGEIEAEVKLENGLIIHKIRVPMGVVAMIYESRPNVTSDAAALCLKSGNACILRGGKEAIRSGMAIVAAMQKALAAENLPKTLIQLVDDTTRNSANELMKARGYVDLLIPRGGAGLIRACVDNATVPCIETGTGICHIYVDKAADLTKAADIVYNAKTSRPSVCNAAEVCLVHEGIASEFLPILAEKLAQKKVRLRLDARAAEIISGEKAGENDFDTEFLDFVMAVAVVDDESAAIEHIAQHSTHHSDAIVTEDSAAAHMFTAMVDSAAVYVNASTRFTDGGEFGLGCEIGISTQKLGARGPMGLKEITSYKYVIHGDGQIRV